MRRLLGTANLVEIKQSSLPLSADQKGRDSMLTHRTPAFDRAMLPFVRQSRRPALTYLVLLAAADPNVAEQLLHGDSLDEVINHPHYAINLDARDRAALVDIRAQARTVTDFLSHLADVADGAIHR
jgi:hypothetical protein